MAVINEHPSRLVRDQYASQVAVQLELPPAQLVVAVIGEVATKGERPTAHGICRPMHLGAGVYLGARMSSKAPDGVVRPILAFVLLGVLSAARSPM